MGNEGLRTAQAGLQHKNDKLRGNSFPHLFLHGIP